MELEQTGLAGYVAKVAGVNDDLKIATKAASETVNRRLDETIPVGRGYFVDRSLKDQDRDAQMLAGRGRGILEGISDIDGRPEKIVVGFMLDADVE
jgi:hypothetical protein